MKLLAARCSFFVLKCLGYYLFYRYHKMYDVVNYYANKSIFITGATGFMGKVLVEKLLRSCPDLKIIYLLVRKKKGQMAEERLNKLMSSRVFEKLLEINPNAFKKLRLVSGDILEEDLGMSFQDLEELQSECEIIVNNAACVRFDLPLQEAVKLNTMGTQKVLQLASTMKKIEVFVHVSTSFCHDDVDVLEEKLYPSPHDPMDVIKAVNWMSDEALKAVEPEIIKPFSNTYGYTKCLAEQLIANHHATFPIVIARPSVVLPSFKEPMPGWVDNINGPGGAIYAASRGVLHSMYCKDNTKVDTIPVDKVINAIIILICVTAVERPKDIRVCNITQSGVNSVTWIEGSNMWSKYLAEYPLSYCLWYPVAKAKNSKLEHTFDCLFVHTLPAYFIDLLLFLFCQKRFMVSVLHRMNNGLELIEYYTNKNWVFKNEYFRELSKLITADDNEIFSTNLQEVEPDKFMKNYVKGMREFYCKEDPSTLPKAKKLYQRLYYLHVAMLFVSEQGPFKDVLPNDKKVYPKVTHCLFDMDGTVLNSEVMYHKMIEKICSKYNRKYTKALQVKMYGVTDREICVTVVNELKMPISIDEFERQLSDLAQKLLPSAPVQEGAERLLTHLHDSKIPMALATNSTEQAVRLHATARPKLFGLFHHKVSVTDPDVFRGKPNPDIYLVAASRFPDKPKPKQCLVFEDSAVGVTSAKEAGMQVVMIPDKRIDREQTRQATIVIRSLLDFQPELFGLPPFDDTPRPFSRIEK